MSEVGVKDDRNSKGMPVLATILYDDRSGSTYLATKLADHPKIGVSFESGVFITLMKSQSRITEIGYLDDLLDKIYSEKKFLDWRIDRKRLRDVLIEVGFPLRSRDIANTIITLYFKSQNKDADVWLIKQGNTLHINGFKKLFPGIKFLHIIRDGRAVYSSKKRSLTSNTQRAMEDDPVRAAKVWKKRVSVPASRLNQDELLELRYEDLMREQTVVLDRITDFLGIRTFSDTVSSSNGGQGSGRLYASTIPEDQKHLHPYVGGEPQKDRITAWQSELRQDEIWLYELYAGDMLKHFGYQKFRMRSSIDSMTFVNTWCRSFIRRSFDTLMSVSNKPLNILRQPSRLLRWTRWKLMEHFR